jgi:hypothetical protein
MKGRYQDPVLGIFLSRDSLVRAPTDAPNLYVYALDNPLRYWDPDGYQTAPAEEETNAEGPGAQRPIGEIYEQGRIRVAEEEIEKESHGSTKAPGRIRSDRRPTEEELKEEREELERTRDAIYDATLGEGHVRAGQRPMPDIYDPEAVRRDIQDRLVNDPYGLKPRPPKEKTVREAKDKPGSDAPSSGSSSPPGGAGPGGGSGGSGPPAPRGRVDVSSGGVVEGTGVQTGRPVPAKSPFSEATTKPEGPAASGRTDLPGKSPGWTKLKGNQGWKDEDGNVWKKDQLHKDHWDISDPKGNKVREVDFGGRQIWPEGPKNKNK